MKKIFLVVFIFSVLLFSHDLLAWGSGHNDHTKFVLGVLPEEITNFFPEEIKKKMITHWSHYPDSFQNFDNEKNIISEDSMKILKKYKITCRYKLHSAKGKAISFILLTKSFKEKRREEAAIWMGSILHAIADEGACNHDPLIHVIYCAFKGGYKIKMGKGCGMDLSNIARTDEGKKIIMGLLSNFKPKILSNNPEEAIIQIMMTGVICNDFMTQRGARIAATYSLNATEKIMNDGKKALAELGADNTRHAANVVITAWEYAKKGIKVELTEKTWEKFVEREKQFIKNRPIQHDSIYSGLLNVPQIFPSVGVIIEPSQTMNRAHFSFGAKYILSAVMRELKNINISYLPIDIRNVEKNGLLPPEKIPVLVMCPGSFYTSTAVKKSIKSYLDNGGKLFLIGGCSTYPTMLGEYSNYLEKTADRRWPFKIDILPKVSIIFLGEFKNLLGNKKYHFVNNPYTPAGWQRPYCNVIIKSGFNQKSIELLAEMSFEEEKKIVSACFSDSSGERKIIFVPEYFIAPFLISGENSIEDPSKPILDNVGRKILIGSLKMLLKDTNLVKNPHREKK